MQYLSTASAGVAASSKSTDFVDIAPDFAPSSLFSWSADLSDTTARPVEYTLNTLADDIRDPVLVTPREPEPGASGCLLPVPPGFGLCPGAGIHHDRHRPQVAEPVGHLLGRLLGQRIFPGRLILLLVERPLSTEKFKSYIKFAFSV